MKTSNSFNEIVFIFICLMSVSPVLLEKIDGLKKYGPELPPAYNTAMLLTPADVMQSNFDIKIYVYIYIFPKMT